MNLMPSAENYTEVFIAVETVLPSELSYSSNRMESNDSTIPTFLVADSTASLWTTTAADEFQRPTVERWTVEMMFFSCLMIACILTTTVGNLLVVLSVLTYPPLKCPPQNHFIVSLACADLTVALLVMPWHVVTFASDGRWPFGAGLCHAWLTGDILTCTASILHLCVIALDRYNAIHDPIRYAVKRTLIRIRFKISAVWLASVLISVPPLIDWNGGSAGDSLYDEADKRCHFTDEKGFVVYSALGSFFLPLVAMSFLYVKIFLATRARLRARVRSLHAGPSRRLDQPSRSKPSNALETIAHSPSPMIKSQTTLEAENCRTAPNGNGEIPRVEDGSIREAGEHTTHKTESHPSPEITGNPPPSARNRSIPDFGGQQIDNVIGESAFRAENYGTTEAEVRLESEASLSAKTVSSNCLTNDRQRLAVLQTLATTDAEERRSTVQLMCCGWKYCRVIEDATERSEVSRFMEARHRLSLSRERRAARTAGIVVGAFVVCWLPFFLVYLIFPFCDWCPVRFGDDVVRLVVWLGYLNSSLNPIIYTVFNVDFRAAFKNILLCLCRKVVTRVR